MIIKNLRKTLRPKLLVSSHDAMSGLERVKYLKNGEEKKEDEDLDRSIYLVPINNRERQIIKIRYKGTKNK